MDMVYRIALHQARDVHIAQDVTQEVFLRLFRTNTEFAGEEHLRRWLIRVCLNECKRSFSAPWRRVQPLEDASEPAAPAEGDELLPCVLALPRKYSLALHLRYYEGYTPSEIATLLRVPASTVRTRLERGRSLLRQALEAADQEGREPAETSPTT